MDNWYYEHLTDSLTATCLCVSLSVQQVAVKLSVGCCTSCPFFGQLIAYNPTASQWMNKLLKTLLAECWKYPASDDHHPTTSRPISAHSPCFCTISAQNTHTNTIFFCARQGMFSLKYVFWLVVRVTSAYSWHGIGSPLLPRPLWPRLPNKPVCASTMATRVIGDDLWRDRDAWRRRQISLTKSDYFYVKKCKYEVLPCTITYGPPPLYKIVDDASSLLRSHYLTISLMNLMCM